MGEDERLREALREADAVLPGVAARRAVRAFSDMLAGLEELTATATASTTGPAGPASFAVDGKQYVTIAVGNVVYTFGLPD